MDAKELRIGNWVYNDHLKPERVCSINPNGICVSVGKLPGWALCVRPEPIPISPEILEKCGFKYNHENESFDIRLLAYGMISIDKDDFSFFLGDNHDELGFVGGIKSCIKYVHQLQNLIFALTGEELEVNLIHTDVKNSVP